MNTLVVCAYFLAALFGGYVWLKLAARLNRHRLPEAVPSAGPDVASAAPGETPHPASPAQGTARAQR